MIETVGQPILEGFIPLLRPEVGAPWRRVTTIRHAWDTFVGFKNGVLRATGTDTLIWKCNKYLGDTETIYYTNWYNLFSSADTIADNFSSLNIVGTFYNICTYIKSVLALPYQVVHSCYWGVKEVNAPFYENEFPVLWKADDAEKDAAAEEAAADDGTAKKATGQSFD